MDIEAHIVGLAVKKLAKEATTAELAELDRLLVEHPDIGNSLKNTFMLWDIIDFDTTLSEEEIDRNLGRVLKNIHTRINAPEPGQDDGDPPKQQP
jgi:hypothetical protein